MKYRIITVTLAAVMALAACASAAQKNPEDIAAQLTKIDAEQAMALANEWKWSRPEVKSHVTTRAVVFETADGQVTEIPLPAGRMVVAVAPYLERTHR